MEEACLTQGLAKRAPKIIAHMNGDHAASVLAYAHHYASKPTATAATMVGVTDAGFVLCIVDGGVETTETIAFNTALTLASEVHKIAVAMHFEAFAALGVSYRLRNGYYTGVAKMAITHTIGYSGLAALGTVLVVGGAAAWWYKKRPAKEVSAAN